MHQLPAILVACGLRDYGIDPQVWGGDPSCDHAWGEQHEQHEQREAAISGKSRTSERFYGDDETRRFDGNHQKHAAGATCLRCGAWRGSLGLEPDHRQYVDHMVEVFRAVRRVLRKDGVLWLNLGDSYATGAGRVGSAPGGGAQGERWKGMAPSDKSTLRGNGHVGGGPKLHATPPVPVMRDDSKGRSHPKRADGNGVDRQHYVGPMTQPNRMPQTGLKPKDLCMMPARVALALQADGWWLRSCLPWLKRNSMPESTADRPASSVEYVFMLTRSEHYAYDFDAVKRAASPNSNARVSTKMPDGWNTAAGAHGSFHPEGREKGKTVTRPKRAGPRSRIRANESFENATCSGVVDERNFRNSDLFFDSLDPAFGLISLADGTPLALDVSPHPFKEAHFATFPPRLVEPLIRAGCPAGGVVLDCFGGSGTVGVVADRMGRDAILIDLNPSYAAMAKARVERDSGMFADVKIE